jgi:hypothetical protein
MPSFATDPSVARQPYGASPAYRHGHVALLRSSGIRVSRHFAGCAGASGVPSEIGRTSPYDSRDHLGPGVSSCGSTGSERRRCGRAAGGCAPAATGGCPRGRARCGGLAITRPHRHPVGEPGVFVGNAADKAMTDRSGRRSESGAGQRAVSRSRSSRGMADARRLARPGRRADIDPGVVVAEAMPGPAHAPASVDVPGADLAAWVFRAEDAG